MTPDLEKYIVSRRIVGFVEVVELGDAFGNRELVQQGLAIAVEDKEIPTAAGTTTAMHIVNDWLDAIVEDHIRAMQTRECNFIRLAKLRGHRLPDKVTSARMKDCGCAP